MIVSMKNMKIKKNLKNMKKIPFLMSSKYIYCGIHYINNFLFSVVKSVTQQTFANIIPSFSLLNKAHFPILIKFVISIQTGIVDKYLIKIVDKIQ